jgi:hypothetical protein
VFLTTDDDLILRAGRRTNEIRTRVMNPTEIERRDKPAG